MFSLWLLCGYGGYYVVAKLCGCYVVAMWLNMVVMVLTALVGEYPVVRLHFSVPGRAPI